MKNLQEERDKGIIVISETKKQGFPTITSFFRYIVRFGRLNYLFYVYFVIFWLGLNIFFQLWCAIWVEDKIPGTTYEYWAIGIIGSIIVFAVALSIMYSRGVELSGSSVYRSLIYSILRRPMSFFDTTTVGTIINRTVVDRENIDF